MAEKFDTSAYDEAAAIAKDELDELMAKDPKVAEAVQAIGAWWKANYMKAGHKRLGRIVAAIK